MSISERQKEIKRRRHRKKKLEALERQYKTVNSNRQEEIVAKVRALTPGANQILTNWGVEG